MSHFKAIYIPASPPQDEESPRQHTIPHFTTRALAGKWGRQMMQHKGDRVKVYEIKEVEVEEMVYDEALKVNVEVGL